MAEQDAQGHLLLGMLLEDAVDVKIGQVGGDGGIQVHQAILGGEHGGRGGEGFGHGLDGEQGGRRDRYLVVPIRITKAFLPQDALVIHDGDRQAGDVFLLHLLGNRLLIFGDDSGDTLRDNGRLPGGRLGYRSAAG